MFHGITNVNLTSDDVSAAARWYAEVLGQQPYFRMPPEGVAQYVEFRFGPDEDELGIMDATFRPGEKHLAGPLVYLQVDDVAAALDRLVHLGATAQDPVLERGDGFMTASFIDPFGNHGA